MKDKKTQWHPGFYAAMRMEFSANKDELVFQEEVQLSKKPLQVDLFVIKKLSDTVICNPIGHIFRRYNLVEYKSPEDAMTIDTFYKVNAYACLFKSSGKVNEYKAEDITITLVRKAYPRKLFQSLEDSGYVIERAREGIYYVTGSLLFPTQIIVSEEMDYREHVWIGALSQEISQKEFRFLMDSIYELKEQDEQSNAEAVLDVVANANIDVMEKWKGDSGMYAALRELMKPEIEEAERLATERGMKHGMEKGIEKGIEQGMERGREEKLIVLICKKLKKHKSIEEIADALEEEVSVIEPICQVAEQFAPDYDSQKVMQEVFK